jgi:hypothetical protein
MATHTQAPGGYAPGFAVTQRRDPWWVGPAITFAVFSFFLVYVHWRMFEANWFYAAPYLSPFYSPLLFAPPTDDPVLYQHYLDHAWFGAWPAWLSFWPNWLPKSPAFFILIFPAGFRFTCYYYRKAYYRSFAGSPPGCAVGPLAQKRTYKGETALLLFQNLHRFFLYFALIFIVILTYDAVLALRRDGQWGIGLGTVIMFLNAFFIAGYTFGCHSFRHLIGGRKDAMSCGKSSLPFMCWKAGSWFNRRHMAWAWVSLIWVMVTDLYIRLVATGAITDPNTWSP